MAVFTTVTKAQLRDWLQAYSLGELRELQGIASGITNTNYFVTTSSGRFVLTLFEQNNAAELPYFLDLMTHLAEHGIPCPDPVKRRDGKALGVLNGKPAALVSCLQGRPLEHPTQQHCAEIGAVLARMHVAGASFSGHMKNPRGAEWRLATAEAVLPVLAPVKRALLEHELVFQAAHSPLDLPTGVIHADLFRDNVLFDGDRLGGVIDFYYACNDILIYDLAVAANDWCNLPDGSLDPARVAALFAGYEKTRVLSAAERAAWPLLLRTAALRFWLSRLYDLNFPQQGELVHAKNPGHFQRILQQHVQQQA